MTIKEIIRFAWSEVKVYKVRSLATIISIGALFTLLLLMLFVVQGLENAVVRYFKEVANG